MSEDGNTVGVKRIEYMPLSDLLTRFHPENPKDHSIDKIVASIQEFGYVSVATLDEGTGLFVEGHGRTKALAVMRDGQMDIPEEIIERNGEWFVPVCRGTTFESDAHIKGYLIASNQLTIDAGFHDDMLMSILEELHNDAPTIQVATGFDDDDLQSLFEGSTPKTKEETEVDFGAELLERHNYIIFVFDNDFDWNVITEAFPLTKVKTYDSRPGFKREGLGRVFSGAALLKRLNQ